MKRSQLDEAYDVAKAVKDFPGVLASLAERGRRAYDGKDWLRNVPYGDHPRERYDFLSCGRPDAATYVFVHGGFWSSSCKEDCAFIADGPIAHGLNVVLAEYALAPHATMTEIVAEIGMLLEHLAADRDHLGIAGAPLFLSGHSAGGHLAAMYRSHPAVSRAHLMSAIVDLEPMSLCWLQDKLKLTSKDVEDYSPLFHLQKGAPTLIAVGENELGEFVRQSTEYATACEHVGERVRHIHVPGATHFSMLHDLANPDGWQMKAFLSLV